ncbi:hypothetical protein P8452_46024 [Trifolium repens]|nr:hypothetical protein P8452_46024 [Trifolium repens]
MCEKEKPKSLRSFNNGPNIIVCRVQYDITRQPKKKNRVFVNRSGFRNSSGYSLQNDDSLLQHLISSFVAQHHWQNLIMKHILFMMVLGIMEAFSLYLTKKS